MRIVNGSSGSFLCPPGHPMLRFAIENGPSHNPNLIAALDYALDPANAEWVPYRIRCQVEKLYAEATLVRSDLWERNVYGYFNGCYAPEGGDRNVSHCIIVGPDHEQPPIERHLAYLTVKEHFPDAEPRPELLDQANTLYGTRPCGKCGATLQYSADVDAFTVYGHKTADCPKGGQHDAGIPPLVSPSGQ